MLLQIRIGNLLYFKEFKNKQALFHPEVSGNSLGMKNKTLFRADFHSRQVVKYYSYIRSSHLKLLIRFLKHMKG